MCQQLPVSLDSVREPKSCNPCAPQQVMTPCCSSSTLPHWQLPTQTWKSCPVQLYSVFLFLLSRSTPARYTMPYCATQNPLVPQLDSNSVNFPAWQSRIKDVLAIQGVLDIVHSKVPCPQEQADAKPIVSKEKWYNPEELWTNWDTLSDVTRSTIKLTLLVVLSICYKDLKPASKLFDTIREAYEKNTHTRRLMLEDLFWCARHNLNLPIAKWIAWVCNAATDLISFKLTPNNQQICDWLLQGLNDSWKPIRDHIVYSLAKFSLDNAIGALELHEVLTQVSTNHFDATVFAVKTKPKLGCWNCGQKGHHSTRCPNPSIKKKNNAQAKSTEAWARSVFFVTLGNHESNNEEQVEFNKDEDKNDDCNVLWG